jgi:hypothetical protein
MFLVKDYIKYSLNKYNNILKIVLRLLNIRLL